MNNMLNQGEDMKVNTCIKIKRIKAITLLQTSKNKCQGIIWKLCSNYTILINVPEYYFDFKKSFYHLSFKTEERKNKFNFMA